MDFRQYNGLFLIVTMLLALFVLSPALERLLALPRTTSFTEFWIVDSNHRAENLPFNISRNHDYSTLLEISNYLGHCAYYLIEVKLRNQNQPTRDRSYEIGTNLGPLFNITACVQDDGTWELPLTFSFEYELNETLSRVGFHTLTLNGIPLDMGVLNYTATWDSEKEGFYEMLLFELWLYNVTLSSFQYHNRAVWLWLNMTDV